MIDLAKRDIDPAKVAKGLAALVINLAEHAPQLALLALAAYADFQTGNIPGMVKVAEQAKPVLQDMIDDVKAQS